MALQYRTEPEWKQFFINAGIPATEAATYATTFVNNGMTELVLPDLNKQYLSDLRITVIGDVLSILRLANATSTNLLATTPPLPTKLPSIKPPCITVDMTHPQFRKAKIDWNIYRQMMGLQLEQIASHLYNACDDDVQTSIINSQPNFQQFTEAELLDCIEKIVTKRVNPTVHRMTFASLIQGEGESIQDFVLRLKSSAVDCAFTCPNCQLDLSSCNIKDQFIRGLSNNILQTDILAKANELQTLEALIHHAEAFETAVRDQCKLQDPDASAARISAFKRQKMRNSKQREQKSTCSGCGSTSHGLPGSNALLGEPHATTVN